MIFEGISSKERDKQMTQLMLNAGVDPAYVYAYLKTGLLVTTENQSLLPDVDLQEWKSAIDEFETVFRRDKTKPIIDRFSQALARLPAEFEKALIFFQRIVTEHGVARNIRTNNRKNKYAFHDFVFFCTTKTLKTLRAIKHLVADGFGEDGLVLCRSLYENYLHVSYVLNHPQTINNFVAVKVGLNAGRYRFDRSKSKIYEVRTGKPVAEHVSVYRMAKESLFPEDIHIYEFLYRYLSDYTHPNIIVMEAYLDQDQFDVVGESKLHHAVIYSLFPAVLILRLLAPFKQLDPTFRKDLQRFLKGAEKALNSVFSHMIHSDGSKDVPRRFRERLRRMPIDTMSKPTHW